MQDSPPAGLRERKRARTSDAIHCAAVDLVRERGLEAATIDAISERAEVSSRTFFNYFPCKEDALLGVDDAAIAAELDRPRPVPDDLLLGAFDLLYSLSESGGVQRSDHDVTWQLVQKYPQLMTRQIIRIAEVEGRLSEILVGWMATDARFAKDSESERAAQARIIIGICLASARESMQKWAGGDAAATEPTASVDPRAALDQSIAMLRTVIKKLA